MCDKRLPDGSFIGIPLYRENDLACNLCHMPDGLSLQERCPLDPSWKEAFDREEYPPCYLPDVVGEQKWYDVCSNFQQDSESMKELSPCYECYERFGFVDIIEEE